MNNHVVPTELDDLPPYLDDYGKLYSLMNAELENLSSVDKGDYFVKFAQRLVPHSEVGSNFLQPTPNEKKSYDKGVDLASVSEDRSSELFIQSKYSLPTVDEFNTIISKFESFEKERQFDNQLPQLNLLPRENLAKSFYMIVTLQDLRSQILPRYQDSSRTSLDFYNQLVNEGRISIIDGTDILRLLRDIYKKSFLLPSQLNLEFVQPVTRLDNVYVGILPAKVIKELYGEYGDALFLENIRDYLGPTSGKVKVDEKRITVNQAIANTLATKPETFLARNNGITFRAGAVSQETENSLILDDASIVNGCQTTMSIVNAPNDKCHVLVKIVEVEDSWDIAEAANFQNDVDQIALKLARYVRPQEIRAAANRYGLRFERDEHHSPFAVLDAIYQNEITEDEFRDLFYGFFSNKPSNIFSVNYTEININVVDTLLGTTGGEKQRTYDLLFRLTLETQNNAETLQRQLEGEEQLYYLFQRFWRDDPKYRVFLTILSACGATGTDIYSNVGMPSLDDMSQFLEELRRILDQDADRLRIFYELAFKVVAMEVMKSDRSREEILQSMYRNFKEANFSTLYSKVGVLALTDDRLKQSSN